ncbi:MAG TPA: ECF-type sigma factor [Steroidobacteraceae bacterium]|jgi:RNA polymerase sigma factor (TIGR02999 family)
MTSETPAPASEPTEAPEKANQGSANEQLFAALYGELRRVAERQLRYNAGAPVSPTTLLHEAYLGMADKKQVFPDQARFIGYAARVMRNLIIDLVRERRALKRGSGFHITQLSEEHERPGVDEHELRSLSDALDELAVHDARLAEVVDLKYFCGLTFEDIAAQRGTSTRTVQRDWEKARAILFQQLSNSTQT